jgi:hypothetical protein
VAVWLLVAESSESDGDGSRGGVVVVAESSESDGDGSRGGVVVDAIFCCGGVVVAIFCSGGVVIGSNLTAFFALAAWLW